MYQIKKKDGSLERYDRLKIYTGALRAGATNEEAEKTTQKIDAWMMSSAQKGVVEKSAVRGQIIKSLSTVNPMAARTYDALQK